MKEILKKIVLRHSPTHGLWYIDIFLKNGLSYTEHRATLKQGFDYVKKIVERELKK